MVGRLSKKDAALPFDRAPRADARSAQGDRIRFVDSFVTSAGRFESLAGRFGKTVAAPERLGLESLVSLAITCAFRLLKAS